MSQGGWPRHRAGPSRPAQGRAPGGAGARPRLARGGRARPGQLGPGRSGLTMTPESAGPAPGARGEAGEAAPPPLPRTSTRQRPTAGGYLLPRLLRAGPGASEARCASRARPLPASESRELRSVRGPGRAGSGGAGRGQRAGRRGRQCDPRRTALRELGRPARAWPSVYVCACQSTLTGRNPLAEPRPRHRPLPPPIGRFEHKGPGLVRPPRGPGGQARLARSPRVGGAGAEPGRCRKLLDAAGGGSAGPACALDSRPGGSKYPNPLRGLPRAPHPTRGLRAAATQRSANGLHTSRGARALKASVDWGDAASLRSAQGSGEQGE